MFVIYAFNSVNTSSFRCCFFLLVCFFFVVEHSVSCCGILPRVECGMHVQEWEVQFSEPFRIYLFPW